MPGDLPKATLGGKLLNAVIQFPLALCVHRTTHTWESGPWPLINCPTETVAKSQVSRRSAPQLRMIGAGQSLRSTWNAAGALAGRCAQFGDEFSFCFPPSYSLFTCASWELQSNPSSDHLISPKFW